jgi:pimeloyl-ACP methyl ester carboxylesterase
MFGISHPELVYIAEMVAISPLRKGLGSHSRFKLRNVGLRKKGVRILLGILSILAGLFLVIVIGAMISRNVVYTPPFKNKDGKVISGSIAEFRRVKLGGYSQGILIRGKSLDNPMILYLHAGPGLSEMGMMRNFNSKLEDYSTMVYLDQRGAGKSYSPFMDFQTLNTEQLTQDIHELTLYLKKRFGKEKIAIMGHCFGAGFAAVAASRYPEDYSACIGISQPVDPVENDALCYEYTLEKAKNSGNKSTVKELEKVKGFWELKEKNGYFTGMMVLKKWIGYYGWMVNGQQGFVGYVLKNSLCSECNIFDYPAYLLGMNASGPASWEIMITTDLRKQASQFKMPFIIMEGRYDYNVFPSLVEEYYNMVQSPLKKIFWFEKSAHFPQFEEKELFQQRMIEYVLPIIKGK